MVKSMPVAPGSHPMHCTGCGEVKPRDGFKRCESCRALAREMSKRYRATHRGSYNEQQKQRMRQRRANTQTRNHAELAKAQRRLSAFFALYGHYPRKDDPEPWETFKAHWVDPEGDA